MDASAFSSRQRVACTRASGEGHAHEIGAADAERSAQVFGQHKQVYGALGLSEGAVSISATFNTQFYSAAVSAQYPKAIRDILAGADQAGVFGLFDCRLRSAEKAIKTVGKYLVARR